uniref:Septin-type G domain-containing protein n=1 Tax=Timema genevievae TaxID=629358 RepID=A0A7R9JZ90_TIMGE|nr:unnamed protein product [Timema genevievae]
MRRLHRKVNIVPVLAKADTLTSQEVKRLKEHVMVDIEENKIQRLSAKEIRIAGGGEKNIVFTGWACGQRVFHYFVCVPPVENPKHSDFIKLRTMLISTHMQDLKDVTQDVHYENFRAQCISQISQQAIRERSKLKRDSGPQFESSITDTDRLLLQKDEEIRRMQDMLTQMQEKLKSKGHTPMFRGQLSSPGGKGDPDHKRDSVVNV